MSTKNKNKKLAYKMGQLLAKMTLWFIYLMGIYTILSHFNIFKIDLCTNTIYSWLELVLFNNVFIWNL
jgi:hypothetical protein